MGLSLDDIVIQPARGGGLKADNTVGAAPLSVPTVVKLAFPDAKYSEVEQVCAMFDKLAIDLTNRTGIGYPESLIAVHAAAKADPEIVTVLTDEAFALYRRAISEFGSESVKDVPTLADMSLPAETLKAQQAIDDLFGDEYGDL